MSVEAPKQAVVPETSPAVVDAAPVTAPVIPSEQTAEAVAALPQVDEQPKADAAAVASTDAAATTTTDAATAPVDETKAEAPVEEKVVEPIHSGALGYKAPGLKNAFRFSKKYFWFGEEPVPVASLGEYLRGEKPEVAHPVVAWSSQTGKGLLYFVKHADKKDTPAGVLNLAYASDLVKDGALAFAFKISGHKHTFEAQNSPERDGWFVAVEKAIVEAKEAKEGIESSESYKEQKEKLGKPTVAAATASAPKKSIDATRPAETEAPVAPAAEGVTPARTGSSSSSSSSDADKKKSKKANKTKSRSASRKRASIFGGLLGKKDKADSEATEPEVKKEESVAPQIGETAAADPIIASDVAHPTAEAVAEPTPVVAETATPAPIETETAAPVVTEKKDDKEVVEKPKPTKRASIFGSFFEKVKSPTAEKKEADLVPATPLKETTAVPEIQKPVEEPVVAVPATTEPTTAPLADAKLDAPKYEANKPVTPVKEKEHFSFGKFFGNKEKVKSPVTETAPVAPLSEEAPKIEDAAVPVAEPTEAAPVVEAPKVEAVEEEKKKEETPVATKKEKRTSIFGNLVRAASKAGGKKEPKEKKETVAPATVEEAAEPAVPVAEQKTEASAAPVAEQNTIGDVVPEAVTVGEAPKSSAPVATTA